MRTKKVYIKCYVPFKKYTDISVPWIDIWITYFNGRKKVKESLTFDNAGHLEEEIEWTKETNKKLYQKAVEEYDPEQNKKVDSGELPWFETKEVEGKKDYHEIIKFNSTIEPEWYGENNSDLCDLIYKKEYFDKNPDKEYMIKDVYADGEGGFEKSKYFEIAVKKPELNKTEIEKTIKWYLKTQRNINLPIRLRWKNNKTRSYIWPV